MRRRERHPSAPPRHCLVGEDGTILFADTRTDYHDRIDPEVCCGGWIIAPRPSDWSSNNKEP